VTAISLGQSDALLGPQPFDARRDLRAMAELISRVFASELDAAGRSVLSDMQTVGRLSPILGGLLGSTLFGDFVSGFVWYEGSQLVGNVTLQRADESGSRWRISNVAVDPAFRGLHIAHRLMSAALHEIALRGGSWAVLQVRVDNPIALHLYDRLGFTDVCRDGLWERASPISIQEQPPVVLTRLGPHHWQQRLELAYATRSPQADWIDPLRPEDFQPSLSRIWSEAVGSLTRIRNVERWGILGDGRLIAAVETVAQIGGQRNRLKFWVQPEERGRYEADLIQFGLGRLAHIPKPVLVAHSGDDPVGIAALEAMGFRVQHVLLTMRRLMTPSDFDTIR
jgi:ribosomal protein S18 acetylase RimI-like enzyme